MLQKLRMQNYRCFSDHTVSFHRSTVVVGRNNAGKSTLVEALHLIASLVNRKGASFVLPPAGAVIPKYQKCILLKSDRIGANLETVFHRYGDPPAIVTAWFTGNRKVVAYVGRESAYATVEDPKGWVSTSGRLLSLGIPQIRILPQIGPLQQEEVNLRDAYVAEHYYTRLSSRHFRNEMIRDPAQFEKFKSLAEETWHGLRVEKVVSSGNSLSMLVTDGDFAAEVAWMGQGLQMWLQTIWFVAKCPPDSTVVLDEPDVYMHPDLQRRLYRLVRSKFSQSIIATHSVEIMAEADPADILIVNSPKRHSVYATTEPGVQVLIDSLGGVHNVHLARLWNAKKVVLLEGKDMNVLRVFHGKLFPSAELPLDSVPNLSIGGWGGWAQAMGCSMALRNAVGDRIATYCIFDRDYHSESEIAARYGEAKDRSINLHVWERKEIENYLLVPDVIARAIQARVGQAAAAPTPADVKEFLHGACCKEWDNVLDATATHLAQQNRSLAAGSANKEARKILGPRWQADMFAVVPGKTILSQLNVWAQETYGAAVGAVAIAKTFRLSEIPDEIREVISAIEEGQAIP